MPAACAGARERKVVSYAENLTEAQFLSAVEEGNLDEVQAKAAARVEKKRKRVAEADMDDDDREQRRLDGERKRSHLDKEAADKKRIVSLCDAPVPLHRLCRARCSL